MHTVLTDSGETDRQMVLIHVDNTLLAMRTSNRLSRRKSCSYGEEAEGSEYAAAQRLLELQRRLFAGAVPVPGPTSPCSPIHQHRTSTAPSPAGATTSSSSSSSTHAFGSSIVNDSVTRVASSPFSTSQLLPLNSAAHYEVSEGTILSAFANVCRSPSTSAVATGVALTALVDMLDLPCGFISTYGIHTAIEAASDTRAEVHDSGSHEVLLSRIFNVYVAALNHPAAVMTEGEVHVRAIGRMMMLATLPEASQLLKRTVERSMRSIVITLFRRLLYFPSDQAEREAVTSASIVVLQFISRLVSGEIAGFDNDGNEVVAFTMSGNDGHGGSAGASSSDERESPTERSVALVQLEGLALAQDCLLLLRCSFDSPVCAPLLDTVQNQLCRALLIAGLGTSRSIVLSQVLRTVHLVMQGASEHLIPQIYNFIRVLHLNPLEALANELSDAGAGGPAGSPAGTNSPVGKVFPASPANAASGTAFTRLSRTQLQRKQERRDILLDSLAEFCSDPRFGSFCFIHYDLSWRYASLLPQLCQVLVNNAYPMGREGESTLDRLSRGIGGLGGGGSRLLSRSRAGRNADSSCSGGGVKGGVSGNYGNSTGGVGGRTSVCQLLLGTQRTALDAVTNMISGIALRAIDAGNASSPRLSTCTKEVTDAQADCPTVGAAAAGELQQLTRQALKEKETLNRFAALFEDSPMKKGIPFLLEHAVLVPRGTEEQASVAHRTQLIVAEPAGGCEIGEALYRLSIVLNKRVLGDYIGEQGRDKTEVADSNGAASGSVSAGSAAFFSVRFFEEQLIGFIHQFQFHSKPLLTAIREMVYLLCLPGESQKIDRVMETFAKHWYEQNLTRLPNGEVLKDETINPFHSESGAFVLSFAIIMLNTDQHSGKVAQQMKKEDFIKMNRGIDDGKDVPTEYLGRVYDDVRQHEVVMADMMDRGFGNDTTWRLEMRQCTSFLQLALSEGATTVQESAGAVESLATMSSHEPTGVAAVNRAAVLRVFDPFLFQALWKRSLLVFEGMLESAVGEISRMSVAQGKSLTEAVADVQQRFPMELSVLQSSLRGVSMLARAAHAFDLPAIADQCLLGLLQHVVMDLSNADEEMRLLYCSVPKMLCLTEVFTLLVDIHSSLKDSWLPLARLILDMQLMGLFADYGKKAAAHRGDTFMKSGGGSSGNINSSRNSASANDSKEAATKGTRNVEAQAGKDRALGSSDYFAVLLQDPGICANVFAPLTNANAVVQKQSGDKGWFSSLFGGGETLQMSQAELSELHAAQQRLRSCIPNMRRMLSLLHVLAADPDHGSRCVMSLCAACSVSAAPLLNADETDASGTNSVVGGSNVHEKKTVCADRISEAAAYAASYELSLICAVVGGASTINVLQPDHLAPLTARITRLLGEVGAFLTDPHADDNVRHYWCSVGSRVVGSAVRLMAAHWRGHEGAVALEQLWTCWMRAPPLVFTAVVAPHVSSFLYHAVVLDAARVAADGDVIDVDETAVLRSKAQTAERVPPWSSGSEVLVLLAPFANHAASTTDVAVQRCITSILFHVVQQGCYCVAEDTESIVSLCLSFSIWARESLNNSGSRAAGTSSVARNGWRKEKTTELAGLPSGTSVTEILSLCGRNVLIQNAGKMLVGNGNNTNMKVEMDEQQKQHQLAVKGEDDSVFSTAGSSSGWYTQWLFVLRSLGALALCSPEARDGSEALLCLQRALLDSDAKDLPAPVVTAVYKDILIPLTERLCVPKAKVQSGLRWCTASSSSGGAGAAAAPGDTNGSNSDSGANSAKPGMVGSLFNALLAPSSSSNNNNNADEVVDSTARRSSASPSSLVSSEVKCRLLSLVPKVLLRYTAVLTPDQDALLSLWRQVLGTLYVVYNAYSTNGTTNDISVQDEAMQVQEAVEETVKNMIYVMAATLKDLTAHLAAFWLAVVHLVQPFPFSGPLIEFMAKEKLVYTAPTAAVHAAVTDRESSSTNV